MFQPSRHLFAFSFSMVCSVVVGISCTASTADEVDASAPSNGGVQVDAGAPSNGGVQADAGAPSNGGVQADAGAPSNGAEPCAAMLVSSQTGSSSTCDGGSVHVWPIGLAPTDCHGWRAVDTSGGEHDNSANQIRCNADGSVSFVQYAGSIDCTEVVGPGVAKTFRVGDCEQDIPPSLYTTGRDVTCCTDPGAPGCVTGTPSALNGQATIYLNGASCED